LLQNALFGDNSLDFDTISRDDNDNDDNNNNNNSNKLVNLLRCLITAKRKLLTSAEENKG
jgi:hypothetical protein